MLKIVWKALKVLFIVLGVYLISLFFVEQKIPAGWVEELFDRLTPANLFLHVDSVTLGFRHGVHLRDLRLYDTGRSDPLTPLVSASSVDYWPGFRNLRIADLRYARLPDSYYSGPGKDRNERLQMRFPSLGRLSVTLERPDILSIAAGRVDFEMTVSPRRMDFEHIRLAWPDRDREIGVDGFCYFDLDRQEVYGEVEGRAWQRHIRPLLVTLEVPVALPYMDAFTDVPEPCPSWCAWKVDLVRKDFDLWLDLRPELGKYNGVPMRRATGKIHLHNCTRNGCLNYVTTVGPISGTDEKGRSLDGTVVIVGTNGHNTVTVSATSAQPLADVLKIGGFTGDYVGAEVVGDTTCDLTFSFPRAMSNNYEVLNGAGHVNVTNGQLMRIKGFSGLIEAMPSIAPAVTWFTDTTEASCDYVIENGIVKVKEATVGGSVYTIRMTGWFDAVRNVQDFNVQVQFVTNDSALGKVLHPISHPISKLLLEFRLTGSPEHPKWQYVSILDRVLDVVK